ncbi:hypothetical protein KZP23_13510 [Echinicola marina]|uniref:hypothetical protein n=1 Tax=Echinicola marina TaxID=2859768 RepID=UPI001CF69033|nr:hypothetical protein [Echinicola marina]UCS91758.1 hypothetical protein KZP23_13510 [Echinicola marina]
MIVHKNASREGKENVSHTTCSLGFNSRTGEGKTFMAVQLDEAFGVGNEIILESISE